MNPRNHERAQRHEFEGEQLTVNEIRQRVPALSAHAIRGHIARGMKTRTEMLNFRRSYGKVSGKQRAGMRVVMAQSGGSTA